MLLETLHKLVNMLKALLLRRGTSTGAPLLSSF